MHIAEKYTSLARDAMSSGDIVAAENYLQHAEHYNRIILAAQAQNPTAHGSDGQSAVNGSGRFNQSDVFQNDYDGEDGEDDFTPPQRSFPERPVYNQNQPQPYIPQNAFPQLQPQPQPVPAPATNGADAPAPAANGVQQPAVGAEPFAAPPAEGDRIPPRRRRRRPIGETQPKTFSGRASNGSSATTTAGVPQPAEASSDETTS